jgi:hypothetical protein
LPSDVSMNAPLRVPTRTRTLLMNLLLRKIGSLAWNRKTILAKTAVESKRANE